ncbi:9552_t:CDS:2, partial [Paraglomus occultum]
MASPSCFTSKYYFKDIVLNCEEYTELVAEFKKYSEGDHKKLVLSQTFTDAIWRVMHGHTGLCHLALEELTKAPKDWVGDIESEALQFISDGCPVVEQFYHKEYIRTFIYPNSAPPLSPEISQQGISQFVFNVLKKLDGSLLRSTYSKSVDGTYIERIYQNEFYRGAWMVMPARLSCDVGTYFGVKGAVDFYLNDRFQWAFELLRDGKRLREHSERFQPNKRYGQLKMKDWAVIDFCVEGTSAARSKFPQDSNHYRLVVGKSSDQATLYHNNTTTTFDLMQSR